MLWLMRLPFQQGATNMEAPLLIIINCLINSNNCNLVLVNNTIIPCLSSTCSHQYYVHQVSPLHFGIKISCLIIITPTVKCVIGGF
ncbi:hypothetical protein NP493_394g00043 [Ridgeia piscesae]|uniref:Uncharacterized protein n=1 Tax=Ridgeia piscesae TaxID=27915 RepID=A0AAD9NT76_RIDPI|nr:hypothetical protein NP493_394g00043 [Ridgeia piscesae]